MKNAILTLGIIVALFLGLSISAVAATGDGEKNPKDSTKTELSLDEKEALEKIYNEVNAMPEVTTFQVYDKNYNLVYETTNCEMGADTELQSMLLKSNHIMNFNETSYFILD